MAESNGAPREIRDFVDAHLEGWNHEDWLGFLHYLGQLGYDVSDPDGIGLALEQERLRTVLKGCGLKGLGPKRIESITMEFVSLQALRHADGQEVASRARLPHALAHDLINLVR
jgi:hypothetical protein